MSSATTTPARQKRAVSGYRGLTFSDPFGLCDPKKDPECEEVAQATAGVTAGSKGALVEGGTVGLEWQGGITVEAGTRQTVNLNTGKVEHDKVSVVKIGGSVEFTFMGTKVGLRVGYDSEDPDGKLLDLSTDPTTDGAIEVGGMMPTAGVGVSGTFRVNPFGAYLRSLPTVTSPATITH